MARNPREDLRSELADGLEAARTYLKQLQKVHRLVNANKAVYEYEVELFSCWADYGERPASGSAANLNEAMRIACDEFKTVNRRSDCQANVLVHLAVKDPKSGDPLFRSLVAEKFWEKCWEKHSR